MQATSELIKRQVEFYGPTKNVGGSYLVIERFLKQIELEINNQSLSLSIDKNFTSESIF